MEPRRGSPGPLTGAPGGRGQHRVHPDPPRGARLASSQGMRIRGRSAAPQRPPREGVGRREGGAAWRARVRGCPGAEGARRLLTQILKIQQPGFPGGENDKYLLKN